MNKEYLKKLVEENKETFVEKGIDIENEEDLEQLLIDYMVNNLQFDFGIDLDTDKLFYKNKE